MALTTAALKPFEALFGDAATLEQALHTWSGSAKAGAKLAVKASIEVGVGMGAATVAQAVTHGGEATIAGADDLVTQGIAFIASKFVHRHTVKMREPSEKAVAKSDRARALMQKLDALSRRADAAGSDRASSRGPRAPRRAFTAFARRSGTMTNPPQRRTEPPERHERRTRRTVRRSAASSPSPVPARRAAPPSSTARSMRHAAQIHDALRRRAERRAGPAHARSADRNGASRAVTGRSSCELNPRMADLGRSTGGSRRRPCS
jgi:hypothetical protein